MAAEIAKVHTPEETEIGTTEETLRSEEKSNTEIMLHPRIPDVTWRTVSEIDGEMHGVDLDKERNELYDYGEVVKAQDLPVDKPIGRRVRFDQVTGESTWVRARVGGARPGSIQIPPPMQTWYTKEEIPMGKANPGCTSCGGRGRRGEEQCSCSNDDDWHRHAIRPHEQHAMGGSGGPLDTKTHREDL